MEDCKLKNSAFDITNAFNIIPNMGKFYYQFIDCIVELKVCILILDGNQLWKNDPTAATFKDKQKVWTLTDGWNLLKENATSNYFILKAGNIN